MITDQSWMSKRDINDERGSARKKKEESFFNWTLLCVLLNIFYEIIRIFFTVFLMCIMTYFVWNCDKLLTPLIRILATHITFVKSRRDR